MVKERTNPFKIPGILPDPLFKVKKRVLSSILRNLVFIFGLYYYLAYKRKTFLVKSPAQFPIEKIIRFSLIRNMLGTILGEGETRESIKRMCRAFLYYQIIENSVLDFGIYCPVLFLKYIFFVIYPEKKRMLLSPGGGRKTICSIILSAQNSV